MIAVLSAFLALTLLTSDPILVLYYCVSTSIATIIAFILKKRLYPILMADQQPDTDNSTKDSTWKMLLAAAFMLIGALVLPLLLAGFLSGELWFIMITSFISGVSISEIALYLQTVDFRRWRRKLRRLRPFKSLIRQKK
jgi:hypothetical protein